MTCWLFQRLSLQVPPWLTLTSDQYVLCVCVVCMYCVYVLCVCVVCMSVCTCVNMCPCIHTCVSDVFIFSRSYPESLRQHHTSWGELPPARVHRTHDKGTQHEHSSSEQRRTIMCSARLVWVP